MNVELYKIFVFEQDFPAHAFPEVPHLVAELCTKENFKEAIYILKDLYSTKHNLDVDTPRKGDGFTTLCKLIKICSLKTQSTSTTNLYNLMVII